MSELRDTAHGFFHDPAHPAHVRELAQLGEIRRYRRGTILVHEGDAGDTLFVVMEGRVKVFTTDSGGREIVFGVVVAGDYFGEMTLDGGPRSASVMTLQASVCALIRREQLLEFLARRPDFSLELLKRVIRRARSATLSAKNFAFIDVYGRLTQFLQEQAEPEDDGTACVKERLTQQDIASRLGCSREMVSRILNDLKDGGYIDVIDRRIRIRTRLPAHW